MLQALALRVGSIQHGPRAGTLAGGAGCTLLDKD